eukprot:gene46762-58309_t
MFEVEKTLVAVGEKANTYLNNCKGPNGQLADPTKARAILQELEAVQGVDYHYKAAVLLLKKVFLRQNLRLGAQSKSEAVDVFARLMLNMTLTVSPSNQDIVAGLYKVSWSRTAQAIPCLKKALRMSQLVCDRTQPIEMLGEEIDSTARCNQTESLCALQGGGILRIWMPENTLGCAQEVLQKE